VEALGAEPLPAGSGCGGRGRSPRLRSAPQLCSLPLYEGRTIVEVARQAGHAPSMSLDTYQHVMDELDGAERVPAEEQIRVLAQAWYPLRTHRAVGERRTLR
jgi:hypothetical protein